MTIALSIWLGILTLLFIGHAARSRQEHAQLSADLDYEAMLRRELAKSHYDLLAKFANYKTADAGVAKGLRERIEKLASDFDANTDVLVGRVKHAHDRCDGLGMNSYDHATALGALKADFRSLRDTLKPILDVCEKAKAKPAEKKAVSGYPPVFEGFAFEIRESFGVPPGSAFLIGNCKP